MGLTRKLMSAGTLGAVDYRSDKERTAAYTKSAKRQAKQQTRIMREQLEATRLLQRSQLQMQAQPELDRRPMPGPPPAPQTYAAGWYNDPFGAPMLRYYDGTQWTQHTLSG